MIQSTGRDASPSPGGKYGVRSPEQLPAHERMPNRVNLARRSSGAVKKVYTSVGDIRGRCAAGRGCGASAILRSGAALPLVSCGSLRLAVHPAACRWMTRCRLVAVEPRECYILCRKVQSPDIELRRQHLRARRHADGRQRECWPGRRRPSRKTLPIGRRR
jgi:hypothetical protein